MDCKHNRVLILCLLGLLFSIITYGQKPVTLDTVWLNYYGGNRADGLRNIIQTYDGKFVGVGHSKSSADFEKTGRKKKNSKEELNGGGNDDILLLQITDTGREEYISALGKSGKDAAQSIIQTYDGGYVLVGSTSSKEKGKDAWIIKLDQDKKHLWNKHFGSGSDDIFFDVVQTSNGDIVACGSKGNNSYVVRLDWQGNLVKEKTLPKQESKEWATSIISLQDGNLAIGGQRNGRKSESFFQKLSPQLSPIGPPYLYFQRWVDRHGLDKVSILELHNQQIALVSPSDPDQDAILVACAILNSNGAMAKNQKGEPLVYHFPKENDSYPSDVIQASDNKLYISGSSRAHNKGGAASKNKFFVTSIEPDLSNPQTDWVFYGGNFEDRAYSLIQSHKGNLFISGASNSENAFWNGGENACVIKTSPLDFVISSNRIQLKTNTKELIEQSGDNLLEPLEQGYVPITIQNLSNDVIHGLQAEITSNSNTVDFPNAMVLGSVAPNSRKTIGIPVKGKKRLSVGIHDFTVKLSSKNALDNNLIKFSIESRGASKSDLQVVASNFERQKVILPNQEIRLQVSLQNKGDKIAKNVIGFFNFEGRNVQILSPKRSSKMEILPNETKDFEIVFKVPELNRGKIIKAKFTFSSDSDFAYDKQEVYPFQVDTDLPLPALVVEDPVWSIQKNRFPREEIITLSLKVLNSGTAKATNINAIFSPSLNITSIGENRFSKLELATGTYFNLVYKFKAQSILDENEGNIELTIDSKEGTSKKVQFPILLEQIQPPFLALKNQELLLEDDILEAGKKAQLQLTIENTGDIPLNDISFIWKPMPGIQAVTESTKVTSFGAKKTKTVRFEFLIEPDFSGTKGKILLKLNSENQIVETDIPSHFSFSISPKPQKKPALLVTSGKFLASDNLVTAGEPSEFFLTIENKGELSGEGVYVVFGAERGVELLSNKKVPLDEIEAEDKGTASIRFKVPKDFIGSKATITATVYDEKHLGGKRKVFPFNILHQKEDIVDYDIDLNWIYPGEEEVFSDTTFYPIRLYASAKAPLEETDFQLYVNDEWVNKPESKFGKVSLRALTMRNNRHKFNFDAVVVLDKNRKRNKIQVVVKKGNQVFTSEERIIIYEPIPVNLHFVGIGISEYTELNGPTSLEYADDDVQDIASIFSKQEGRLFSKVYPHVLSNASQTRKTVIEAKLNQLKGNKYAKKIKSKDVLIFYISSHGLSKGNSFKIQPSDYQNLEEDDSFLLDFEDDILSKLKKTGIKNIFVFIDACHSGSIASINVDNYAHSKTMDDRIVAEVLFNLIHKDLGIVPIVSCQSNESSWEHPDWENGAFTEAMKEAFTNQKVPVIGGDSKRASPNDSALTFTELFNFLKSRVPYLVQKKNFPTQTPYIPKEILQQIEKENLNFFLIE